jgi:hypothetical protein
VAHIGESAVECRAPARTIPAFLDGNAIQVMEGLASVTFQLGTCLSLSSFIWFVLPYFSVTLLTAALLE